MTLATLDDLEKGFNRCKKIPSGGLYSLYLSQISQAIVRNGWPENSHRI